MKREKIKLILFVAAFFTMTSLPAQNVKKEIESLENQFKNFQYSQVIEKGKFLLADRFTTRTDSLEIYKYMLSSAYAISDTTLARSIIQDILHTDPKFTLNPLETSPKIIEFFNVVKLNLQKDHVTDSLTVKDIKHSELRQSPSISPLSTLSSVLLPGSGHLLENDRKRGILFTSISGVFIGSIIYSSIVLSDHREQYMQARDGSNYDRLYNQYNRSYKIRNTLLSVYGLWNLYTLYNLHTRQSLIISAGNSINGPTLSIQLLW